MLGARDRLTIFNREHASQHGFAMSHNLRRLRHVRQPSLERVTFRRFLADSSGDGVDGPGPAEASCS